VDEGAEREMEGVEGWDVESEREVESWEMDWNDDLSESRDASRANARDFICVHPLSDLCAAGKERDVPFVLCRSLLSVRDDGYTPDSASLHPVPVSLQSHHSQLRQSFNTTERGRRTDQQLVLPLQQRR
jgi:hypothetical protein